MTAAAVGVKFFCPRRDEMERWMASQQAGATFWFDPEAHIGKTPLEDTWRDEGLRHAHITGGLPTCSYCGSLRPQDFVAALTRPGVEIHGTDKRYKAYVILPNPNAGNERVVSAIPYEEPSAWERDRWIAVTDENRHLLERDGWGRGGIGTERYRWMMLAPDSATSQAKFYFQHIAHPSPERAAFYDWFFEGAGVFYSGTPLGVRLEHIARHPELMSEGERTALAAFRERNPEIAAP